MTILAAPPPAPVTAKKTRPSWDSFLAHSKVPQGHTDELLTWLAKVQQKKASVRANHRRDRDLRVEAMLEAARVSAQAELEAKQRSRLARWRGLHQDQLLSPPSSPEQEPEHEAADSALCDCESCVLCARHKSSMYGKCYCNMIFSPRPVFMDFTSPLSATDAFSDDTTSIEADNFLASLGGKRKSEDDQQLTSYKRARA